MADEPNNQQSQATNPSPPAPVTAPSPPAPAAPVADPQAGAGPQLSPGHVINWTDAQGNTKVSTLGQLIEAMESGAPKMSADELREFQTYQRAIKQGDPEAARQLFDMYATKPAAPAASGATPPNEATSKEIADLRAQLQRVQAIAGPIEQAQHIQQAKMQIDSRADQVPYLAADPIGPTMVLNIYKEKVRQWQAGGMAINQHTAPQIFNQALLEGENFLKSRAMAAAQIKASTGGQGAANGTVNGLPTVPNASTHGGAVIGAQQKPTGPVTPDQARQMITDRLQQFGVK